MSAANDSEIFDNEAMSKFFRTEHQDGRWWFFAPDGQMSWSIGMNHIDSAALRFADSGGVWERDFGNSKEQYER